jgi:hypothetical protein
MERVIGNGDEPHLKIEFVRTGRQVRLRGIEAAASRHLDQNSERDTFMDHRLTNIQNDNLMMGERGGKFCCEPGTIVSGKMDENCLV